MQYYKYHKYHEYCLASTGQQDYLQHLTGYQHSIEACLCSVWLSWHTHCTVLVTLLYTLYTVYTVLATLLYRCTVLATMLCPAPLFWSPSTGMVSEAVLRTGGAEQLLTGRCVACRVACWAVRALPRVMFGTSAAARQWVVQPRYWSLVRPGLSTTW